MRCAEHPVRVLVVDDQEVARRALSAVVEATDGFVVVGVAVSGEESLTAAADLAPDLVLMDVNLPGIDGITAMRTLADRPHPPRVVLLSTYAREDLVDELGEQAATTYVPKSEFGPDRLRELWASIS